MPRNGVGIYVLPAGQPVVAGTVISDAVFNTLTADIADTLTASIASDGQKAMTANLPLGNNKITSLAAATVPSDAARFDQVAQATQAQTYTAFTTAGTSTAFTLTPSPVITSYVAGQSWWVTLHTAAGVNPTLQVNGVATPPNLVRKIGAGTYTNISSNMPAGAYRITMVSGTQALVEGLPLMAIDQGGTGASTATAARTALGIDPFVVPPGTIIDFGGNAAPTGYLACPIAATNISRTTYAALFAAIGTLWGVGDGSTTFGMPYFPNGYPALNGPTTGTGQTTVGQILDHSHPISSPNGATSVGGAVLGHSSNTGAVQSTTGTNFAAGMYVLKCVKF